MEKQEAVWLLLVHDGIEHAVHHYKMTLHVVKQNSVQLLMRLKVGINQPRNYWNRNELKKKRKQKKQLEKRYWLLKLLAMLRRKWAHLIWSKATIVIMEGIIIMLLLK